jgi:hypothetical protein
MGRIHIIVVRQKCGIRVSTLMPGEGTDTERLNSPWCNRGHFAVATFLHRGVFKTAHVT